MDNRFNIPVPPAWRSSDGGKQQVRLAADRKWRSKPREGPGRQIRRGNLEGRRDVAAQAKTDQLILHCQENLLVSQAGDRI